MTDFPFDIVGFDLDGTLLDTSGDLTAAVNHTLALAGKPLLTIAEVKPMIGGGAKMMLEHGLKASGGIAEEEFRPLYRAMMAYYADHVSVHTRPFPGAVALLDQLDAMGVRYGIVTNKFESLARQALSDLGLLERMVAVIGADTLGKERARPSSSAKPMSPALKGMVYLKQRANTLALPLPGCCCLTISLVRSLLSDYFEKTRGAGETMVKPPVLISCTSSMRSAMPEGVKRNAPSTPLNPPLSSNWAVGKLVPTFQFAAILLTRRTES